MSELSEESKALLEREAPLDEATVAEIEAMRLRVAGVLGAPSPLEWPGEASAPSTLVKSSSSGLALKVAGSALVAALGSSALLFALNNPRPAQPTPARLQASASQAAPAPAPVAVTPPPSQPALPAEAEPSKPKPSPSPSKVAPKEPEAPAPIAALRTASEEALLVAAAEAQQRAGHAAAALSLYERHLREYPQGALRHESWSGRLIALCGLGRQAEARAELAPFAQRQPGSPAVLRIRRACGDTP